MLACAPCSAQAGVGPRNLLPRVLMFACMPCSAQAGVGPRNLLPYMKKLPIKRVVHFSNVSSDPIQISLEYNTTTPHGLPPGVSNSSLAAMEITGIDTVIARCVRCLCVSLSVSVCAHVLCVSLCPHVHIIIHVRDANLVLGGGKGGGRADLFWIWVWKWPSPQEVPNTMPTPRGRLFWAVRL